MSFLVPKIELKKFPHLLLFISLCLFFIFLFVSEGLTFETQCHKANPNICSNQSEISCISEPCCFWRADYQECYFVDCDLQFNQQDCLKINENTGQNTCTWLEEGEVCVYTSLANLTTEERRCAEQRTEISCGNKTDCLWERAGSQCIFQTKEAQENFCLQKRSRFECKTTTYNKCSWTDDTQKCLPRSKVTQSKETIVLSIHEADYYSSGLQKGTGGTGAPSSDFRNIYNIDEEEFIFFEEVDFKSGYEGMKIYATGNRVVPGLGDRSGYIYSTINPPDRSYDFGGVSVVPFTDPRHGGVNYQKMSLHPEYAPDSEAPDPLDGKHGLLLRLVPLDMQGEFVRDGFVIGDILLEVIFTREKAPVAEAGPSVGYESTSFTIADSSGLNQVGAITLAQLLGRALKVVMGILGSLALLMFIYGGVLWMTARGNAQQAEKAMQVLLWAGMGVVVILASYAVVDFVFEAFG